MNKVRIKIAISCVIVILILILTPNNFAAQSNSPGVEMRVEASFDGNFKYGEWLPLWVTLENNGPDLEARVQTRINQSGGWVTFAKSISLPTGSRKQVILYILPNNFSREIDVHLVSEDTQITSQKIEVVPNQNDHFIIGIASPQWGPLAQISSLQFKNSSRDIVLVTLNTDQFPDKIVALNSLDAIILNDTDTSQLTDLQKNALENWVRSGGFLILGGGSGIDKLYSGLPESLAKFNPGELVELSDLPDLEQFAQESEILVEGPFIVSGGSFQDGISIIAVEGTPLLHQWVVGEGKMSLVAINLTDSPFNAWSGTPIFWENLLGSHAVYPMWLPRDMSIRQMRVNSMAYPLSNLTVLDLPSVQGLSVLLIIYILLIGPTNYFILKKRNKLHLAWITIPALTAVFAIGAFGMAISLRGNDIMTNKLSIISLHSDGQATIDSYIGIFSPAQESFEIEVSGNVLLSPSGEGYYDPWISAAPSSIGETIFLQDDPARVVGLDINQWSMQTFNSENVSAQLGRVKSNLTMTNNHISGEIQSLLDSEISGAVLVVGNDVVVLGDIDSGEIIEINHTITSQSLNSLNNSVTYLILDKTYPSGGFNYSRDYEMKRAILDNVFQPFGYWVGPSFEVGDKTDNSDMYFPKVFMLGWLSDAPPEISINGRNVNQQALALLSTHIPIQLQQGHYSIPPGIIEGKITEQPLSGGYCGSAPTHIYLDYGSAEFEFKIPKTILSTQLDQLIIGYYNDIAQQNNNNPGTTLSLFDWENLEWVEITNLINGINIIDESSGFINQYGFVRIQVEKEAQNIGGCIMVALGLEGTNP